ncbi:hypothetical protein F5876DRAFT_78018 [Lentinula aff. lateritia]|uniref:Uncharacterized protein n=1 Tax=Lentinula aff. lateritia TaxID=2804960 RepID=A0ACC1TX83_9AGAR|nr:hypothetical protein F5876DRAFT_78018 [Lentinula aff. lateritia]
MSVDPSADDQLIQAILSATDIVMMEHGSIEDASQSTRSPSLYDLHLPKQLQLRMLKLGTSSSRVYVPEGDSLLRVQLVGSEEVRFLNRLLQRPAVLELLRGIHGVNLRQRWSANLSLLIAMDCIDEESVVYAENTVSMVIADLLALVVVDLSEVQFAHMSRWKLFSPYSSREKETKADLLFGLHLENTIKQFDVKLSNLQGYQAIWPLVKDFNPTYMRCITSMECKNIALGDPKSYLMLLLLTRLMTDRKIREFWPGLDCKGCQEFAVSHYALARDAAPVRIPDDDPARMLGIKPTTDSVVFRAEFERLLALIPSNNVTAGASDSKKTVGPPRNKSTWYNIVYQEMEKLLVELGHPDPRELNAIMHWVTPIRNIMIQNWSQMVRHNLTLSTVTHFAKSFGVRRDREDGCATISLPDSADSPGYLLRRVARNLDAWMDALARSRIEQVPWTDIYRKGKKTTFVYHSASEESDDSNDDSYQPDQGDMTTDEGNTEEDDNEEDDTDEENTDEDNTDEDNTDEGDGDNSNDSPNQGNDSAGPRGGAGAGGNSGSGLSGQGRSSGAGSSNTRTKRSLGTTYSQRDNKRPRQHSDFQVILNRLHLAFNCPGEQLLSDGFSKYSFIPMAESTPGVSGATNVTAALPVFVPSGTVTPPRRGSLTSSISSGSGTSSSDTDAFWSPMSTASSIHSLPLSSPQSSPVRPKGITTTRSTDNSLTQTTSQSIVEMLSATSLIESHPQNALSIVDHAGVILDTKVHQSTIGIVWAGKMYLEGLTSTPKPLRIVVKLTDWERDSEVPEGSETLHGKALRSEAKIYHHLVGSNIGPHFYGVFNNSGSIALVLEYKGTRLPDFGTLADDSSGSTPRGSTPSRTPAASPGARRLHSLANSTPSTWWKSHPRMTIPRKDSGGSTVGDSLRGMGVREIEVEGHSQGRVEAGEEIVEAIEHEGDHVESAVERVEGDDVDLEAQIDHETTTGVAEQDSHSQNVVIARSTTPPAYARPRYDLDDDNP